MLTGSPLVATAQERTLFSFDSPEAAKPWQTVNDGVMGGRSVGRFKINEDKKMEFFGTLSLENNGGFASVRARGGNLGLKTGDVIIARVRGDGRQYNFNLYTERNRYRDGHFFVVGGLPDDVKENYVYEYDGEFKFLKKHIIKSGHTHLGIQTATFAHDRWWFGCYGDPKIMLVTDADFQMKGRYEIDCSLGIEGMTGGRLLVGNGRCEKDKGCNGTVQTAFPDDEAGFTFQGDAVK